MPENFQRRPIMSTPTANDFFFLISHIDEAKQDEKIFFIRLHIIAGGVKKSPFPAAAQFKYYARCMAIGSRREK